MTTVFLFGAGASAFSGECYPSPPPLGKNLFDEMNKQGFIKDIIPIDLIEDFKTSFESGMYKLDLMGSEHYLPLMRSLALFLARYEPGKNNLYSSLLAYLYNSGQLKHTVISTINYDILIEKAANNPDKLLTSKEQPADFSLLKIHGSCNLIPDMGGMIEGRISSRNVGCHVDTTNAIELNGYQKIKEWCEDSKTISFAPIMATYMQGKPARISRTVISEIQSKWRSSVLGCKRCYIIGVNLVEEDAHIWDVLKQAKCEIRYVDPYPQKFIDWVNRYKRKNAYHYCNTFLDALYQIMSEDKSIV